MASYPARHSSTTTSRLSTLPSQKPRQLSHLQSQLAQLTAHMSDLENLLRMTAVQAESMRGLGGYAGGIRLMAASKVLGEEAVNATNTTVSTQQQQQLGMRGGEKS
ncbi:DASH complex subunit Hsk3 like-domain-containing protein [Cryomyces antarcticus]